MKLLAFFAISAIASSINAATLILPDSCGTVTVSGTAPNQVLTCLGGTVTVPTPTPTPVPTPTTSPYPTCAGYTNTKVIDAKVPANGAATNYYTTYKQVFANSAPGWGAEDMIIVKFTAPVDEQYFRIRMSSEGVITSRFISLSTTPCNLKEGSPGVVFAEESVDPALSFATTPGAGGAISLKGGTTYYLNMTHKFPNGSSSCETQCDATIGMQNPRP